VSARRSARAVPALVLSGWALLLGAWLMGNPPFASPDESSHYLRALAVGSGHLITAKKPELAVGTSELQLAWTRRFTRAVEVPPGLTPLPVECYILHRDRSAACIEDFRAPQQPTQSASYTANYPPLPYLISGPLARTADDPATAVRLGRLPAALVALLLLGIATWALWDRATGGLSLLGLLLAVTPMALLCGASLTGSSIEIAGGIAFFATLLRLARTAGGRAPASVWAAMAFSGAVLAHSRSLGPLWAVLQIGLVVLVAGPRESWAFMRRNGRAAYAALGVLAAALILARAWEALYGGGQIISLASLPGALVNSLSEWWRASSELIGKFSYLEYRLPSAIYVAWFAFGFAAIWLALRISGRRERIALVAATAFAFVFPVAMWLGAVRFTGFGLQGRYVLPVLVAVPLLAGELVYRHRDRLTPTTRRVLARRLPVAIGVLQLLAFWFAARRVAVGTDGPVLFPGSAEWSPPGGWPLWIAFALAGSACIATAGLARGERGSDPA
jgi:hypothetical protein